MNRNRLERLSIASGFIALATVLGMAFMLSGKPVLAAPKSSGAGSSLLVSTNEITTPGNQCIVIGTPKQCEFTEGAVLPRDGTLNSLSVIAIQNASVAADGPVSIWVEVNEIRVPLQVLIPVDSSTVHGSHKTFLASGVVSVHAGDRVRIIVDSTEATYLHLNTVMSLGYILN